jgi:hypothetical protein
MTSYKQQYKNLGKHRDFYLKIDGRYRHGGRLNKGVSVNRYQKKMGNSVYFIRHGKYVRATSKSMRMR